METLFNFGAPGRIRTHDPLVRSQVLYPTELRALQEKDYSMVFPHNANPPYDRSGCQERIVL